MHKSDHLPSAYPRRYVSHPELRKRFFRWRTEPHRNYTRSHGAWPGQSRSWDQELRSRGYRVTPQRQLVLEAVATLDHATPEEIAASVQRTAKGVNISTIYRTLELLDSLGLVAHTHLNHGAPTYHLATEAGHVHLVCQDCGKIDEASRETITPLTQALDDRTRVRGQRLAPDRVRTLPDVGAGAE